MACVGAQFCWNLEEETNIPLKKLLKVKDSFATHFLVLFDYCSNPPLEIMAKYTCTCLMNIKASHAK